MTASHVSADAPPALQVSDEPEINLMQQQNLQIPAAPPLPLQTSLPWVHVLRNPSAVLHINDH
jgi:hypothetical protein